MFQHANAVHVFQADIQQDLDRKARQITMPEPDNYNQLILMSSDFLGRYAYSIFPTNDNPDRSVRTMLLVFGGLLLLFILLPTLNLINLNVSRILERSAEIGVRKAFGAHSQNILLQLLFENVVLTFLGGFLGLVLALGALFLINDSNILPETVLRFNLAVFLYSLLICLLFGIISGLLPAWRMSKLQIANAIKQNQL
jgi:putative ABC transport system permease protein